MDEQNYDLYFRILKVLEQSSISYVIIGAFAGMSYGITRATVDIDMVVDLKSDDIEKLVAAFPPPRYYEDPYQIRDSIHNGTLFNIIDTSGGLKADLIPLTMEPSYDFALSNRIRRPIPLSSAAVSEAWFAKPEDIIVGKLMAWREGRSFKHEQDIRDMLIGIYLREDTEIADKFNTTYIDEWAVSLGSEVENFWTFLQELSKLHLDNLN